MTTTIYALIGLLVFVWPMDHIIAIRNITLVFLFLLSWFYYYENKKKINILNSDIKLLKTIYIFIVLFIFWSIVVSYYSSYRDYALKEISQFKELILLGITSYFLINSKINYKNIFIIIFTTMLIFPIYHSIYSFHYLLYHKSLPYRSFGITVNLDGLNFLMPFILAFFAIEFIFRFTERKTILSFLSNKIVFFLFTVLLFSLIVQSKRNGIISLIFMLFSIIFFIKIINRTKNTKNYIVLTIITIFSIIALGYIDIKVDKRWKNFNKSLNIVFVKNNMDDLYLKIPPGVDASAYQRMFFIREGLKLITDKPMGYGFGRGAYGKALSNKYHIHRKTHAHSGIIDWGVGIGLPGLFLFSGICFILIYLGIKNFIEYKTYFALLLTYVSTSFYFRNFLDSLIRDHMLQQFVFLSGLCLFAMYREINEKNNLPSS